MVAVAVVDILVFQAMHPRGSRLLSLFVALLWAALSTVAWHRAFWSLFTLSAFNASLGAIFLVAVRRRLARPASRLLE